MKKMIMTFALSVIMAGCAQSAQKVFQIPDIPDSRGVSAPFAGFLDQTLLVGGGCNFPDVPAAEGGKKEFYDAVYACQMGEDNPSWKKVAKLPVGMAYGATVETPEGLVLIGGQANDGSHGETYLLQKRGDVYDLKQLPSLPVSIDNAAATVYDHTIYITGGNHADGGQLLYALGKGDKAWRCLSPYTGGRRIQPVLLASHDHLYLAGGFDNTDGKSDVFTDMLVYSIEKEEWTGSIPLPTMRDGALRACVGAAGVAVGSNLVITGGVNHAIFKEAISGNAPDGYLTFPVEWYQFNDDVLVFNTEQNEWKVVPEVEGMAKAGGVLLQHAHQLFMVCGELKPGIRTPKITIQDLDTIFNR